MIQRMRQTIAKKVSLEGIGLHSGQSVRVNLNPAHDGGIRFIRSDLSSPIEIPASYQNVQNTFLATTLENHGASIATVEHLLSALFCLQISDCLIEVFGAEIPVFDGSSMPFIEAIEKAGIQKLETFLPILRLKRRVEVYCEDKWAIAEPSHQLEILASIEWDHPAIGYQEFHFIENATPSNSFARARTFGFLKDVELLKKQGLALGGSLENAVVLDDFKVLNQDGLRYPNEFVRHKVLDALGDFALSPARICAKIHLHRSGHELHSRLLRTILANETYFEIQTSPIIKMDAHSEAFAWAI